MKKFLLTILIFCAGMVHETSAQVTGADTVCAGYIYTYSVNIANADSFVWTVPNDWYGLTGQGSSVITVTCNVDAGDVCVDGYDSLGTWVGNVCLTTQLGSEYGNGSWQVEPSGGGICQNMQGVAVTPTITFIAGPGNCLEGCDVTGILHPNLLWGIYNVFGDFMGEEGTLMWLPVGLYNAYYVDTTLGADFPQAIRVTSSSCGIAGGGLINISHTFLYPVVNQSPDTACIGDTVTFQGNGPGGCWGFPYWTINSGLTAVTSIYDMTQFQAVVTNASPSLDYRICTSYTNEVCACSCTVTLTYNVIVSPCNASASFQSANTTVCENTCINFTNTSAHANSFTWNFPGAIPSTSTDANPSNICYSSIGTWDVSLVAVNATDTDTVLISNYITVISPPQASFATVDTVICSPHCIDFSNLSSNASTYQWSFPGAVPISSTDTNPVNICYNNPGTYDVNLISSNAGCSDSITALNYIEVNPGPQALMSANPLNLCPGTCTDFTNSSIDATSWQWQFPGAVIDTSSLENPLGICYNVSGQYDVILISSNSNCSDTLTASNYIIVYPQPLAQSIIQNGDTLFANTGASSYQWYYNSNAIAGATDFFYVAFSSGDYNVVSTDSNGCESEAVINNVIAAISVQPALLTEGSAGLAVFPNPVEDKFTIQKPAQSVVEGSKVTSGTAVEISIYNVLGERVQIQESRGKMQEETIDVSKLISGIYYLEVTSGEKTYRAKFIKSTYR